LLAVDLPAAADSNSAHSLIALAKERPRKIDRRFQHCASPAMRIRGSLCEAKHAASIIHNSSGDFRPANIDAKTTRHGEFSYRSKTLAKRLVI
jgi:hypothetical protein